MATSSKSSGAEIVPSTVERGSLLVADISGYTNYVVSGPLEYAEDVVAEITRDIVERLEPILRINKLEGDAAFGYALDGELDASMLLDSIEECYFGFRRRLRGIEHSTNCSCNACAKAPELNLKFVVHHGDFIRRPGQRGEELTGHDVILVHRLLKNAAAEVLGLRATRSLRKLASMPSRSTPPPSRCDAMRSGMTTSATCPPGCSTSRRAGTTSSIGGAS
jgi:hypothetical protein